MHIKLSQIIANNHPSKFFNILFVNIIIMTSHIKNLLKQLPFYGKTKKSWIKEFTNAKWLSELPFFEKPIKAKIKQLSTKKLLSKQPFYKQPTKTPRAKKLSNLKLLQVTILWWY